MKLINIEDSEADYELILHNLKKGGIRDIVSKRVQSEVELRELLKNEQWDLVLCDYNIPGFDPLLALGIVREFSAFLPFVVVSGLVGEESVADMMKDGVEDFVIKSRLERLAPVVRRALREQDIQIKEATSREIARRALAAKEEMLAIVYHDIKNPLAAIQLDAQLLERLTNKEPSAKIMEELKIQAKRILRTVNRLKILVSDMLSQNEKTIENMSSEHSFIINPSIYNPYDVLNEVLDSFRPLIQEKNVSVKKIISQRKMSSYFDKDRIFQVLSNLMSNALKFTPAGGEITLELEESDSGDILFSVSDTGPGIPQKDLDHIFDKFWTGGSGTGLGLYICKTIVEAHGGTIEVTQGIDRGAKVWFKIPYYKELPGVFLRENYKDEKDKKSINVHI